MPIPDLGPAPDIVPATDHLNASRAEALALQMQQLSPPMSHIPANESLEQPNMDFRPDAFPVNGDACTFPSDQSADFDYEVGAFSWEDFDLNDIDSFFLGAFQPESVGPSTQLRHTFESGNGQRAEATEPPCKRGNAAAAVEHLWFTRMEGDNCSTADTIGNLVSGISTPGGGNPPHRDINESDRLDLSSRLRPQWSEDPLPSTEFLVGAQCYY